jgi:hypothetical protein
MRREVSSSKVDYFIRCVLTILLGVLYYGLFFLISCVHKRSDVKWCV